MTATHPQSRSRLVFPRLHGFYASGDILAYAALRIGFGIVILTHGLPKLLGIPHGSMTDPLGGATRLIETSLGLPFAPQLALLITALETGGAVALAAGLFTRIMAPIFAVQMLVICYALRANFAWIDRGWEFPLVLGLVATFIALRGGGQLSIDRWIGREV